MKFLLYLISLIFLFYSCNGGSNNNISKTIDFKTFSIEVPSNWSKIDIEGIDSYVGGLLTEKNDTIIFDYGKYTPENNDVISVSHLNDKNKLDSLDFPVEEMFFSKFPNIDMNQGTFHKEFYYYEKIDNRKAKIKVPKKIGDGVTSVFFDSLSSRNNKLYLYGHNLDTLEQFKLINAFETMRITE